MNQPILGAPNQRSEPHPGVSAGNCPIVEDYSGLKNGAFPFYLRCIFSKEILLGPDPDIVAAVEDTSDISLAATIKGVAQILFRNAPLILVGKTALTLVSASVPLMWSWVSGNVVGSFSSLVPDVAAAAATPQSSVTWGIETAIVSVGVFAILSDLQGRIGNWFASWESKTISRLSHRLAFQVTDTWTYEDLENSKKQLAYERFKEHSGKLFEMLNHSIEAASATIVSFVAVGLLWPLDWRLSCAALAFMSARVFRDLKESKTSFAIERISAEARRFLAVKEKASSDPRVTRDMRLLGMTEALHDEFQRGTHDIHQRVLANERRIQSVRLCYDLIPAVIQLTSVALILKGVANASIPIRDAVAFMGYSFNLIFQCRGVGLQIGRMLQAKTFAAEGLDFLSSALTKQESKVRIPERSESPTIALDSVEVHKNGRCILNISDLKIEPGQIVGIAGPEGAGKSTFLKALLGMRQLSKGRITLSWGSALYDLNDCDLKDFHRLVACNNQDFFLPEGMTVKELLDLGRGSKSLLSTLTYDEALDISGAAEFVRDHSAGINTIVGTGWSTTDPQGNKNESVCFSPGQRKLIGLAVILSTAKPFIVLDEPSAGVSRTTAQDVLRRICDQARYRRATVIIVSHNSEDFRFVDRILCVEGGKIVADGPPTDMHA